jgi:hypothetical protein
VTGVKGGPAKGPISAGGQRGATADKGHQDKGAQNEGKVETGHGGDKGGKGDKGEKGAPGKPGK